MSSRCNPKANRLDRRSRVLPAASFDISRLKRSPRCRNLNNYFVVLCPPIAPKLGEPESPLPFHGLAAIGLGAVREPSTTSSISKSSCSSSILSRPTLLLLIALSRLVRPVEPLEAVLTMPTAPTCELAASSFVRCSSLVSMLMLACRGGLLTVGLRSPFALLSVVGKYALSWRSGEPTTPSPSPLPL
jgi:hypothetical protein